MRLPYANEMRAERFRLIETLDTLSDDEFDAGPTLCTEWAPRDILGHVISIDYPTSYLRYGLRFTAANMAKAEIARQVSRERLMEWARHWADEPVLTSKMAAPILLGDLAIHHQDILRGLGRERQIPDPVANVILWEGLHLSLWMNRRVLRHRIVPTDGHKAIGRGGEVRGTREALGLWLCGRDTVAAELEFA